MNYAEIFHKLVPGLAEIFQDTSMQVILYGSVARGTQTEESDVDIAVILHAWSKADYHRMIDFVVDLELEYNVVLSVQLIEAEKFARWENIMPYYKNVKKDGIVLWPAA